MNLKPRTREDLEVNVTPLIDVVFLLLIFFMITTTFVTESALELTLPEASNEPVAQQDDHTEITVTHTGKFYVNEVELVNNQLITLMSQLQKLKLDPEKPIIIRADANVDYKFVVRAMDAAGQLGLTKIALATSETVEPDSE